jgi:hypothetical protein
MNDAGRQFKRKCPNVLNLNPLQSRAPPLEALMPCQSPLMPNSWPAMPARHCAGSQRDPKHPKGCERTSSSTPGWHPHLESRQAGGWRGGEPGGARLGRRQLPRSCRRPRGRRRALVPATAAAIALQSANRKRADIAAGPATIQAKGAKAMLPSPCGSPSAASRAPPLEALMPCQSPLMPNSWPAMPVHHCAGSQRDPKHPKGCERTSSNTPGWHPHLESRQASGWL